MRLACERSDALASHNSATSDKISNVLSRWRDTQTTRLPCIHRSAGFPLCILSRPGHTVRRLRSRVSYRMSSNSSLRNDRGSIGNSALQLGIAPLNWGTLITSTTPSLPLSGLGDGFRHACRTSTPLVHQQECRTAGVLTSMQQVVGRVEAVLGPEIASKLPGLNYRM